MRRLQTLMDRVRGGSATEAALYNRRVLNNNGPRFQPVSRRIKSLSSPIPDLDPAVKALLHCPFFSLF